MNESDFVEIYKNLFAKLRWKMFGRPEGTDKEDWDWASQFVSEHWEDIQCELGQHVGDPDVLEHMAKPFMMIRNQG